MTPEPYRHDPAYPDDFQGEKLRMYLLAKAAEARMLSELEDMFQDIAGNFESAVRQADSFNAQVLAANECVPPGVEKLTLLTFDRLSELFMSFGFTIRRVAAPATGQ